MICPLCDAVLDLWDMTPDRVTRPPRVNDIALCGRCGAWLMVVDAYTARTMTDHEWLAIPTEIRVILTRMRETSRS
jgi:hypothetical protein